MTARIICGDCLDVLRGMADRSVDAVITDPPFFLPAQHYAARKDWGRSLADLSILEHFYQDVFTECRRVLRSPGHMLVFCDSQSYPVFYTIAYRDFLNTLALVWDKGRIGLGLPWRNQHELIMAAWDKGALLSSTSASTVLKFPPTLSADRDHPAEKPVELMQYLCKLVTPPRGLVLDPFAGSGTTGAAALNEGLEFVGIERDPKYAEIARGRLATCERSPPLVSYFREAEV